MTEINFLIEHVVEGFHRQLGEVLREDARQQAIELKPYLDVPRRREITNNFTDSFLRDLSEGVLREDITQAQYEEIEIIITNSRR